jgi:hypothetical protein
MLTRANVSKVPPDFWYKSWAQRLHDLNTLIFEDATSHAVIHGSKTDALRLQTVAVELQAKAEVGGPEHDLQLANLSREVNMMQRYSVAFGKNNVRYRLVLGANRHH